MEDRSMKAKLCFLMVTLCFIWSAQVGAQDSALVQAARKEGKVVWYTSLALPRNPRVLLEGH